MVAGVVVAGPVMAQAAGVAGKALGGDAAKGTLLTREELRACLTQQADHAQRAELLEKRRNEASMQSAAARQQLAEVQAERLAFGSWQRASQALNERVQQHSQRVAQYNQRVKAFQESRPTAAGAERERGQIEAEAEALAQAEAALKAEAAQLDANIAQARSALTARAQAQASAASAANATNAQIATDTDALAGELAAWQQRCGSRPYLVADEKAIRAQR